MIDVEKMRALMDQKGSVALSLSVGELQEFGRFLHSPDIRIYLTSCVPEEVYEASGLRMLSLTELQEENLGEASPGMYLFPRGYLVIGTSVGGNAVCLHEAGPVYWVDHSSFYEDRISYQDRDTKIWHDVVMDDMNLAKAIVPLADDLEVFLEQLLADRFVERLDSLD